MFPVTEVIAKSVGDGETPSWYDPNGYKPKVLLYFGDEKIELDLKQASVASKVAASSSLPEYASTFRNLLLADGFSNRSLEMSYIPKIRGNQPIVSNRAVAPDKQVVISGKNLPLKITAFYHDILVSHPFIILVFNTQAIGYSKIFPEGVVDFTFDGRTVTVKSLGLIFTHNDNEYCVLYMPEEVEESKHESQE